MTWPMPVDAQSIPTPAPPRSTRWRMPAWGLGALLLLACDVETLRNRVRTLTPHEQYAAALKRAGLDSTAMGREWLAAGDSALRSPVGATLPFREAGFYSRGEARAVAYAFPLVRGQRLQVLLRQEGQPALLFLDLYRQPIDSIAGWRHLATAQRTAPPPALELSLSHEVRDSATYVLRLQPELLREGRYELLARAEPVLAFPVEGGTNRSVQSLFGVDRDAGRRRHEGIDIFAARGTPAVAVTRGIVRSTRPNQLGGTVVWLHDAERAVTLYYAHLDALHVREGDAVDAGDTVGFVGNTGNARTTRPHLHFGIYARGEGAIDPWPWVRIVTNDASAIVADTTRLGRRVVAASRTTVLRRRPGPRSDSLRTLGVAEDLRVMGAQAEWYRVQLASGETGYVTARAVTGRPVTAR